MSQPADIRQVWIETDVIGFPGVIQSMAVTADEYKRLHWHARHGRCQWRDAASRRCRGLTTNATTHMSGEIQVRGARCEKHKGKPSAALRDVLARLRAQEPAA